MSVDVSDSYVQEAPVHSVSVGVAAGLSEGAGPSVQIRLGPQTRAAFTLAPFYSQDGGWTLLSGVRVEQLLTRHDVFNLYGAAGSGLFVFGNDPMFTPGIAMGGEVSPHGPVGFHFQFGVEFSAMIQDKKLVAVLPSPEVAFRYAF